MLSGNPEIIIEYESNDLLVVNKPAGLPVYSTKKHRQEDSVLSWLLKTYPKIKTVGDNERPGIVHRLDKQTSGLLVLAKNNQAFEYLKKLFASRNIVKEYTALVYGELPRHGVIEKPLTKIGQEGRSRVRVDEKGKKATTEYWSIGYYTYFSPPHEGEMKEGVIENMSTTTSPSPPHHFDFAQGDPEHRRMGHEEGKKNKVDTFTLVKIKLHTGRTHQIRVHFSHVGHPVMGDDLYGKPMSQKLSSILGRQFLHASRLELKLMDGTWLEVESKLPYDLEKVLKQLQRN